MFARGLSSQCVAAAFVAVVVGDDDAIALYCYSTVPTKFWAQFNFTFKIISFVRYSFI
jgi:hypothetical protein